MRFINFFSKVVVIMLLITLTGCLNPFASNNQNNEAELKSRFPILGFVENFVSKNPNYDNNNLAREKADTEFYNQFMMISDSVNLINGIPVKLITLNDLENGGIMAQFRATFEPQGLGFYTPIYNVNFDVIGKIADKYVYILDEDTYYTIHGKFIARIENIPAFEALLGRDTYIYTELFSVRKKENLKDKYEVNLGMMYFDIDSISVYKK